MKRGRGRPRKDSGARELNGRLSRRKSDVLIRAEAELDAWRRRMRDHDARTRLFDGGALPLSDRQFEALAGLRRDWAARTSSTGASLAMPAAANFALKVSRDDEPVSETRAKTAALACATQEQGAGEATATLDAVPAPRPRARLLPTSRDEAAADKRAWNATPETIAWMHAHAHQMPKQPTADSALPGGDLLDGWLEVAAFLDGPDPDAPIDDAGWAFLPTAPDAAIARMQAAAAAATLAVGSSWPWRAVLALVTGSPMHAEAADAWPAVCAALDAAWWSYSAAVDQTVRYSSRSHNSWKGCVVCSGHTPGDAAPARQ